MSYKVGVSAAIFVEMVARREVSPHGVYPSEVLSNGSRATYLERLREHHITFEVEDLGAELST